MQVNTIHVWSAIGNDPRYDGKEIWIYFGYAAQEFEVVLALQQLLGYVPAVADKFPLTTSDTFHLLDNEHSTLQQDTVVRMPSSTHKHLQAGTPIKTKAQHQLLFELP